MQFQEVVLACFEYGLAKEHKKQYMGSLWRKYLKQCCRERLLDGLTEVLAVLVGDGNRKEPVFTVRMGKNIHQKRKRGQISGNDERKSSSKKQLPPNYK